MVKKKELLIEITNKCPLNCVFCSSHSNLRKNSFINKKTIKKILLDAKRLRIEKIQLSGGEPFQHPDIDELIGFILDKNFELEIYTCGSVFSNGNYQSIPEDIQNKYRKSPNLTLRFNFQTIDKEVYGLLTQSNFALENVINSIKSVEKFKIKTEVHIIPTNLNISQLDETIDFLLNELKVTHIKILRLIFHGRAKEHSKDLIFDEKALYQNILRLKQKYSNNKVEIGTAFSILSNSCIDCQAIISKYMITTDLKLFPCTAFKNRTNCYVKIDKQNSLKKIISHKRINRKIQRFNENLDCSYCLNSIDCVEICPIQKLICKNIIKRDLTNHLFQSKVVQLNKEV